jgi:hypothetical protein
MDGNGCLAVVAERMDGNGCLTVVAEGMDGNGCLAMVVRVQRFLNLDDIYPSLETCCTYFNFRFQIFCDVFTAELLK